jgi:sigma-B regulation protein RsbU (phosphoserine phosphatase)
MPSEAEDHRILYEAVLCVPLVLPAVDHKGQDQVLGVMTLVGKPPGDMFTAGDGQLATTIMTQVTAAIHNSRLVRVQKQTERVQQQMEIAARIQQSLLPKYPPKLPNITLAAHCLPTANVGGDYYDYLVDEDGCLTVLVADASGHSIGSALMITMARSILRHELARGSTLDKVLANTNRAMIGDLMEAEMFISLFCARYNPATQQIAFANAGHNPPLLQRAANGQTLNLTGEGPVFGLLDNAAYEERAAPVERDDILLLYTDGMVEARNLAGEQFGVERLQDLLKKHRNLSPNELKVEIFRSVSQFTRDTEPHDDITLLILKVGEGK